MSFEREKSPFSSSAETMSRRDLTPALRSHTKYLECLAGSRLVEADLEEISIDDWMKLGAQNSAPPEKGFLRVLLTGFDSTDGLYRPFTAQVYDDLVNLYGIPVSRDVQLSKFICTPTSGRSLGIIQTSDVTETYMALEYDPAAETSNCVIRFAYREDLESMNRRLMGLKLSSWHPLVVSLLIIEEILKPMQRTAQVGFFPAITPPGPLGVWPSKPKELIRLKYKADTSITILDSIEAHQNLFKTASNPHPLSAPGTTFIPSKLSLLHCTARNLSQLCSSILADNEQTSRELMNQAALTEQERTRAFNLASYIFLPMTAVATLFSMSFFDFKQEGQVVSDKLWIFFVVATLLSAVLNAGWMMLTKRGGDDA